MRYLGYKCEMWVRSSELGAEAALPTEDDLIVLAVVKLNTVPLECGPHITAHYGSFVNQVELGLSGELLMNVK